MSAAVAYLEDLDLRHVFDDQTPCTAARSITDLRPCGEPGRLVEGVCADGHVRRGALCEPCKQRRLICRYCFPDHRCTLVIV